jgi:hypothetical protein
MMQHMCVCPYKVSRLFSYTLKQCNLRLCMAQERFSFPRPFCDEDGLLRLSEKQVSQRKSSGSAGDPCLASEREC